jgi:DNA-binding transcriptional regulator YhcF (GntR family)
VIVEVDTTSPVPPYEQLRSQIAALVSTGALSPGSRLASIRQLANDLGVATGTVARAYRELEAQGVVRTGGRHGTVIAEGQARPAGGDALLGAARRYVINARRRGAGMEDAVAAVRAAWVAGTGT